MQEAIARVAATVTLPAGYRIDWAGEYASQQRAQRRLMIVVPLTVLIIVLMIKPYGLFGTKDIERV